MSQSTNVKIVSGNAYTDRNDRQWLIGSFIDASKGLRKQSDIEVMWSTLKKGDEKGKWTKSTKAPTLTILIKGKFSNIFPGSDERLLEKEGDYIIYPPETPHTWKALEDSTMLTIRWPSAPDAIAEVEDGSHA